MYDELRHLLLVVEHGTLTAAARRAHLSQPAITASIHRLEERVGATLLHRGRRGAELTAAGHALVPRARAALALIEEGVRAVAEVEGLRAGEVRIGAGATACTYLLPEIIARFRDQHPGITVRLREAFSDELHAGVDDGSLDLAVVTGKGSESYFKDTLVLVASPDLEERARGGQAGFVTFPEGSATRAIVRQRFPAAEIVMELSSIAAVKGNVRAGVGVALLSLAAIERDLGSGQLVEIPARQTPIRRTLSLVHRGRERLTPAASAFRRLLLRSRRSARPGETR